MSTGENQSSDETVLLSRLEKLETKIKEHDDTQRALRWISLTGIFAVLLCFSIFVYRLYDYVTNYEYQQLVQKIGNESANIIRPELEIFLRVLKEDLIPEFSEKFSSEFNKSIPTIKSKAMDLSEKLKVEVVHRTEERLLESMIASLENSSDDIKSIFPEFTPEDLEKQIGESIGFYVEKLHEVIEERIALVAASLEGLKNSTRQLQKSEEAAGMMPQTVSQAEEQLIDSLLELIVFEIRPELGKQTIR